MAAAAPTATLEPELEGGVARATVVVAAAPPKAVVLSGEDVTDATVAALPGDVAELNVCNCRSITAGVSFAHLVVLKKLDCRSTAVGDAAVLTLPASLETLNVRNLTWRVSFAHLRALKKLDCSYTNVGDAALASLPASLEELDVHNYGRMTAGVSFAHLRALKNLNSSYTKVGDAAVASLPASLEELDVIGCGGITAGVSFAHLRALKVLDCGSTAVGDAAKDELLRRGCAVEPPPAPAAAASAAAAAAVTAALAGAAPSPATAAAPGAAAAATAGAAVAGPRFGIVCALSKELVPVLELLRDVTAAPAFAGDTNTYRLGSIAGHRVVVAAMPFGEYGEATATSVATNMARSFRGHLECILLVGIGGGVPSKGVRLGDVVISAGAAGHGVLQYDYGKATTGGAFEVLGQLKPASIALRTAAAMLAADLTRGAVSLHMVHDIGARMEEYRRPPADWVFPPTYRHMDPSKACGACCDATRAEVHDVRDSPRVYAGVIASGNAVMKDADRRDAIAREHDVLCFEMEAAGVATTDTPFFVIRGICDYCDSHKRKEWQPYAAAAAAAYLQRLLEGVVPRA